MSRTIRRLNLLVIMGISFFFSCGTIAYSMICGNFSECGFEGELCDPDGGSSGSGLNIIEGSAVIQSSGIGSLVAESAGYLLNSYSGMTKLLNRIETAGVTGTDYNEWRDILYNAIEDMEKARATLETLKETADRTPYNMSVIYRLWFFDYDTFQVENGLLPDIFGSVKNYLRKGDIRGIYNKFLKDNEALLEKLYTLKTSLDTNEFPQISSLWRINQDYAAILLFGQYTSEVFKALF